MRAQSMRLSRLMKNQQGCNAERARNSWQSRFLQAVLCGLLTMGLVGCSGGQEENQPESAAAVDESKPVGEVRVEIVSGPEDRVVVTIPEVVEGTTLLDVMKRIENPQVSIQGSESNALVIGFGDLMQAGGEGWTYRVNGEWADRGVGAYEVKPGDTILWSYGSYDPEP